MAETRLQDLCPSILLKILGYISVIDLVHNVSLVSKQFYSLSLDFSLKIRLFINPTSHIHVIENFLIQRSHQVNGLVLNRISGEMLNFLCFPKNYYLWNQLTSLTFIHPLWDFDDIVDMMYNLSNLKSLNVQTTIKPFDLNILDEELQRLNMCVLRFTYYIGLNLFTAILSCKRITHAHFEGFHFDFPSVHIEGKSTNIKFLRMTISNYHIGYSFAIGKFFPNLEQIIIDGENSLQGHDSLMLNFLFSHLPNLRKLSFKTILSEQSFAFRFNLPSNFEFHYYKGFLIMKRGNRPLSLQFR